MKTIEHNELLGVPTFGFVSANVTHMSRFVRPETKHQALSAHFLRDSFGLILGQAKVN